MFDTSTFNVLANSVMILGGVVIIYGIFQLRQLIMQNREMSERLEQFLAPKVGIEGFLNMCAQVVECDPDGTCVVADKDGEIVMVNRRFEEMSGYHRSELVGQPVEIMVPDKHKGVHPSHRENYLASSSNRPMRGLSFRHKRGREIAAGIWLGHFSDPNDGYTIVKMRSVDGEMLKSSDTLKCIAE
jgi:PAS domain S-box-containing protein